MRKIKVYVEKFIRYCSGVKRHAWYESNVGVIRKPIQSDLSPIHPDIPKSSEKTIKLSWWKRLFLFIKKKLGKRTMQILIPIEKGEKMGESMLVRFENKNYKILKGRLVDVPVKLAEFIINERSV